ncbi:MAG: hypothetical protein J0M20_05040 [Burkholderiales bacterium]|nr:hypothetical protein [Burkholderiales bacterium]
MRSASQALCHAEPDSQVIDSQRKSPARRTAVRAVGIVGLCTGGSRRRPGSAAVAAVGGHHHGHVLPGQDEGHLVDRRAGDRVPGAELHPATARVSGGQRLAHHGLDIDAGRQDRWLVGLGRVDAKGAEVALAVQHDDEQVTVDEAAGLVVEALGGTCQAIAAQCGHGSFAQRARLVGAALPKCKLVAICGGYQMLGRQLHDPLGLEGRPASVDGLGLIDAETVLEAEKQLVNVTGTLQLPGRPAVQGYEIHMGVTRGPALTRPSALIGSTQRADGVLSEDGQILGTYVHGLFDHPDALAALLAWAGVNDAARIDLAARREADLDRLADSLETSLHLDRLADCFGPGAAANALRTSSPAGLP